MSDTASAQTAPTVEAGKSAQTPSDNGGNLRAGHPSPHRHKVSVILLLASCAAGPAAWIGQMLLNYVLAGYACAPLGVIVHAPQPPWTMVTPLMILVQAAAVLLAVLGTVSSWRMWRSTRHEAGGGGAGEMMQAGEGRTRFIAVGGLLMGLGFLVAIAINIIILIGAPLCRG